MSKKIDCVVDDIEHGRDPLNHRRTHFDAITETPEKLSTMIEIICDNGGCPPDKDCSDKQDCHKCLLDWLNQPAEEDA